MSAVEWNESLTVGIPSIDAQHRTWIERLNAVSRAVANREGPAAVGETLGFLVDYTERHFASEEQAMAESAYPGIDIHRRRHQELRDTLNDLVRDYREEGATDPLAEALNTFLGNWLARHIRDVDRGMASHLLAKGVIPRDQAAAKSPERSPP
jgi:hemerythrin